MIDSNQKNWRLLEIVYKVKEELAFFFYFQIGKGEKSRQKFEIKSKLLSLESSGSIRSSKTMGKRNIPPGIRLIFFQIWRDIVMLAHKNERGKEFWNLFIFSFLSQMSSAGATVGKKEQQETQYWRFFIRFAV